MKRLVLAWGVTVMAATGAAVAVLGLLGGSLTRAGGHVMSAEEVSAALAAAPTQPPASSPPSDASGQPKAIRTAGGTVIASCADGLVRVRSWTPAQGYAADEIDTEPDDSVKVEFDAEDAEDVEVELGCANGVPVILQR